MVRLFVLSSGGSVFDWLVVRFGGDKDGVKGHRGTRLVRPSRESSSLPLELKTGGQHTQTSDSSTATPTRLVGFIHCLPSEMPCELIVGPVLLLRYRQFIHEVSAGPRM